MLMLMYLGNFLSSGANGSNNSARNRYSDFCESGKNLFQMFVCLVHLRISDFLIDFCNPFIFKVCARFS